MKAKFFKSDFLQRGLASLTVLSLVLSILAPAITLPTVAEAATPVDIFSDDFNRSEGSTVGNGWVEQSNAPDDEALSNSCASEAPNKPYLSLKGTSDGTPLVDFDSMVMIEIDATGYQNLALSYDWAVRGTEGEERVSGQDKVFVQWREVGEEDWNTLREDSPDAGGTTGSGANINCDAISFGNESDDLNGADDSIIEIRFAFAGTSVTEFWLVDNVSVTGEELITGSISGYKWNNENEDNVWDEEEELGLPDWTITLYDGEGEYSATTTDAEGYYFFENLPLGTYYVCESVEEGWLQDLPLGDGDDSYACENGTNGYSITIDEENIEFNDQNFGNHEEGEEGGDEEGQTLTSTKTYGPSSWENDEINTCSVQEFTIPEQIDVVEGNAGNHWTKLNFFNVGAGTSTTCVYQGGSSQAHPSGEDQIALGQTWNFYGCYAEYNNATPPNQPDLGFEPGDKIMADKVTLEVNGSSQHGTTVGEVLMDEEVACEVEDTTPPGVPDLVSPADGSTTTSTGLILDWTDETDPSSPVTYDYQSSYSDATTTDNALASPIYNSSDRSDSQIDASGSADNTYFWQVRACDSVGNCSDWSGPWKVVIDSGYEGGGGGEEPVDEDGPKVAIDFPRDEDRVYGEVLISGIVADENPSHYWLRISGDGFSYTGGPGTVSTTTSIDATTTLFAWDTTGLDEGWYFIKLEARDIEGNKNEPEGGIYPDNDPEDSVHWIRVKVDHDHLYPPTLVSPVDGSFAKGDVLTNVWEEVPGAAKYIYRSYHDADTSSIRWTQFIDAPATSKTATNVAESTFWWRVAAIDDDEDQFDWSPLWKVIVDNTAPTTTIDSPAPDTEWLDEIMITGTTTDNNNVGTTTVAAAIYDGESCGEFSDIVSIVNSDPGSLPFEWSFSWTPDEENNYCIKAYGEDLAGNVEGTAIVQNVKFTKTVPPPVEEESSSSGGGSSGYRPSSSSDGQGGSETGFALPAGSDLALGPVLASGIGDPSAGGDGLLPDEDTSTSTDELSLDEENSDLLAAAGLFGSDNWWAWILLLILILLGVGYYWYRSSRPDAGQGGMF